MNNRADTLRRLVAFSVWFDDMPCVPEMRDRDLDAMAETFNVTMDNMVGEDHELWTRFQEVCDREDWSGLASDAWRQVAADLGIGLT
jgi:hypothetical protein